MNRSNQLFDMTWQILFVLILTGGLSAMLSGCSDPLSKQNDSSLPTIGVTLGGKPFTLEVANTDATRQAGLMYRQSMASDHGMLFVFDRPEPLSFWMKNTLIPLDIVFLDEHARVLNIEQMKPLDEWTQTRSFGAAQYAIELNQGIAKEANIQPGDIISLPPAITKPK